MDIIWTYEIKKAFVPHYKINITIQITTGHFVSVWSLSFGREDHHIF